MNPIFELKQQFKVSNAAIAARLGVDPSTVSRMERRDRLRPSALKLIEHLRAELAADLPDHVPIPEPAPATEPSP